jgi:hypothetical protein
MIGHKASYGVMEGTVVEVEDGYISIQWPFERFDHTAQYTPEELTEYHIEIYAREKQQEYVAELEQAIEHGEVA